LTKRTKAPKKDVVEAAILDAQRYASRFGVSFSDEALDVLRRTELLAQEVDSYVYPWTMLAVLLPRVKEVRAGFARLGSDPDIAAAAFDDYTRGSAKEDGSTTEYDGGRDGPYSATAHRRLGTRPKLIDTAINIAQKETSRITGLMLFETLLDDHEELYPSFENGVWTDKKLHTPFITMSHILGRYDSNLFFKLSDLRNALGLPLPNSSLEHPAAIAPPWVRSSILSFLVDHPHYERNCFLVMPFATTRTHRKIYTTLKTVMTDCGFNLVRADERTYSDDLLTNIEAHVYGCRFAIAVFERILTNDFNPNVSLEVGYFFGLRKPVCLLKERTLPKLPSDLVGRLYVEFDGQDVARTIRSTVKTWLRARGLVRSTRST
jgi:hypothetical protein